MRAPGTVVSSCLPRTSGRDRFQQLHHRLVGPVIRVFVDLGDAAGADRRIDVLALAESVPKLLHLIRGHVVEAPPRWWLGHQPHIHQKIRTKPTGSIRLKRVMVDMRLRSAWSNSALRLSFLARSLTALLMKMNSKNTR